MRIAFAGASGTGKTTLMNHVVSLTGLEVCPVGSRQVAAAMGFTNPYDVDAAGRRDEFQRRLFEGKRDWEASRESFISDRTAFDNLVYATMHGVRMKPEEIYEYAAAMRRYTLIIYLPICAFHHVGNDPARVKELGYHQMFDLILRALLNEYSAPHETLFKLESRKAAVEEIVNRCR